MKEIAIHVEGGGDTAQQRAELRNGLDQLLHAQKQAARAKKMKWKLVPSGGRQAAYGDFINAVRLADDETLCVLLVDSEEEIQPETAKSRSETSRREKKQALSDAKVRRDHLANRDKWDPGDTSPEQLHLMVRCMEAWIVSDSKALATYYGKGFRPKSLPTRDNLEDEPKQSLYDKLQAATKNTAKGEYAKIKHASKLLALIEPTKVASRCSRFATFTSWLDEKIRDG